MTAISYPDRAATSDNGRFAEFHPASVRARGGERGHCTERWEYDLRAEAGCTTLGLTCEGGDGQGRLAAEEEVAPEWLHNCDREAEYLGL